MKRYEVKDINFVRKSHEYEAMMGEIPSLLIRCGIPLAFFVMIALLLISAFIEYPETIEAKVVFKQSAGGTYDAYLCIEENDISLTKSGQNVYMELNAYPSEKFGIITGVIANVHIFALEDGKYLIPVEYTFPPRLEDNIANTELLNGKAEIVVKQCTLLEKIFFK